MTTSQDPDEIRAEIERTRAELSDNVDALADTVTPARRPRPHLGDCAHRDRGSGRRRAVDGLRPCPQ